MIKITKHNHPDKTVIYATYLILKKIRTERVVSYVTLLNYVQDNITSGEFLFMPALNLLYLLGLVEYQAKTDSIEYIEKPHETI